MRMSMQLEYEALEDLTLTPYRQGIERRPRPVPTQQVADASYLAGPQLPLDHLIV